MEWGGIGLSQEIPSGLTDAERFLGLLLLIIGVVVIYATNTNPPAFPVSTYFGIFIVAGIVLIALGVFLVLAKTE